MVVTDVENPVGQVDRLLMDVSILLREPAFGQTDGDETSLRSQLIQVLTALRTYNAGLRTARESDPLGLDPSVATRIFTLQSNIDRVSTDFDVDLVPRL